MNDCYNINNLVTELQAGCYSGMCSNNKIISQIRKITSELEIKIDAFPLTMQMEGRECTYEKIETKETFKVPGKIIIVF